MTTLPTSLTKVLRMLDKHGPVTVERASALLAGSRNLEADLRRLVGLGRAETFIARTAKGETTAYRITTAARVDLRTGLRSGIGDHGAIPPSRPAPAPRAMPVLDQPEPAYRPPAHCYQGAYDNESLPSLIGQALHYRDGRIVRHPATEE